MSNEETQIGHLGSLLRKLVNLHIPAERAQTVIPTAARLLKSTFETAQSLDSTDNVTKSMLFRLVRDRKHQESSRLANVTSSLKFQRGLSPDAIWPVLYVLNDLSGTASPENVTPNSASNGKHAQTDSCAVPALHNTNAHITDISEISAATYVNDGTHRETVHRPDSANPFVPAYQSLTEQPDSLLQISHEQSASVLRPKAHNSNNLGTRTKPVQLNNNAIERGLVQDLLLVVQGENGNFLSFNSEEEENSIIIQLPSNTDISLAARDIVLYVAELGFLFRVIKSRVEDGLSDDHEDSNHGDSSGQVSENMYRGVAREMDTYYRSLMTLRGMDSSVSADDAGSETLTLRKMFVWADTEKPRLRWLARLCEETKNLQGGQILSLLRRRRGSYVPDDIRDMISRILSYSAAPINRMLVRWLSEGEIVDDHGEFYVKEDPKVAATMAPAYSGSALIEDNSVTSGLAGVVNMASLASHRIWWGLFKMRKDMLPGAVNVELAEKTLIAGKSVAFLRRCCGDSSWVDRIHAPLIASLTAGDRKLFEADYKFDKDVVREVIEKARDSACMRLKDLFFDKFDLSHHFGAIKRYLLLSQGDFSQALMDTLAPILDGEGEMARNTLTGAVDASLQGCSSYVEETDEDILERLDVQIVSDGDSGQIGWDVFSLTYRVQDAPLNTVFSEKVMEAYLVIFRFLWKLKRMDHLMTRAFLNLQNADVTKGSRTVGIGNEYNDDGGSGVREVLKRAHHLRMKMTHVVHNLQHYCTVEVLEGCWGTLESEMMGAEDLDGMIKAHAKYLTVIKDRTLLSERSKYVARELDDVLGTIPVFDEAQRDICEWARSIWKDGSGLTSMKREVLMGKLTEIERGFDESFKKLLKALSNHTRMVETCVFLLFRLDFNRYYARRSEEDGQG